MSKKKDKKKSATAKTESLLTPAVDPMQWWGALTKQFTELASAAIKNGGAAAEGAVAAAAPAAATAAGGRKQPARKAAAKKASAPAAGRSRGRG